MNPTVTSRFLRTILITLDTFLAITAIAGGVGLLTGLNAPPVDLLAGSAFGSYTVPGLALLVLVGGSALGAALMTFRRHQASSLASMIAGGVILAFEIFEAITIGSPPGVARNLQVFYVGLGVLIVVLAIAQRNTSEKNTLHE